MEVPFEYLGYGKNRIGFRHGKFVVKIPLNDAGIEDNVYEANLWRKRRKTFLQLARCRLIPKTVILVMEYVQDILYTNVKYQNLPDWALFVDCQQVGFNSKGKLVAYDYA